MISLSIEQLNFIRNQILFGYTLRDTATKLNFKYDNFRNFMAKYYPHLHAQFMSNSAAARIADEDKKRREQRLLTSRNVRVGA